MITRRNFIITSAATASSPLAQEANAEQKNSLPLKALPKARVLHTKPSRGGRLLLVSDGPEAPQPLIKTEVLERAFGKGINLNLTQPDHWRMIEEGWFSGEELYQPEDPYDPTLMIWQANYRPETEAHDLLYDLFRDLVTSPFGVRIPELGLELAEHPSTPRYATAKLDGDWCLANLTAEVAERTSWLVIDECTASSPVPS
jgi:hypothetical protein